ncbi:MAG: hypothetical protein ACRDUV_05055 [Pseudonocardiaceae bacterium]
MSTLGELLDELTEQLGPPDEGMSADCVGGRPVCTPWVIPVHRRRAGRCVSR